MISVKHLLYATAFACVVNAPIVNAAPHQEVAGNIHFDAVDYLSRVSDGVHTWSNQASNTHMQILPDIGTRHSTAADISSSTPRIDYDVDFASAGTYYVFVKAKTTVSYPNSADSVHIGLNGTLSGERVNTNAQSFAWFSDLNSGARATITVPSAGVHNFSLFMREDGAMVEEVF